MQKCPLTLNNIPPTRAVLLKTGKQFVAFNADALLRWIIHQESAFQIPTHPLTRTRLSVNQIRNVLNKSRINLATQYRKSKRPVHPRVLALRAV